MRNARPHRPTRQGFTMPLHGYTTERYPPTILDHIYAHPFELALAVWGILGGLGSVAATVSHTQASAVMNALPTWLLILFGALLTVGAALIMTGLFDDSDDLMRGWRIERTGLVLSGFGWAAYTVTLAAVIPRNFIGWGLTGLLTLSMGFRFRATQLEERRVRKAINR